MRLPVSYVGLGSRALDLVSVRGRHRLRTADLLVADLPGPLAVGADQAELLAIEALTPFEVTTRLKVVHEDGKSAVRAVMGGVGDSVRALDEIRLLLEGNVPVELVPATAQDTLRWPWQERLPLGNRTIAVTRIQTEADAFSELLRRLGAEVIEAPTHTIAPPEDLKPLDAALDHVGGYGFVVLTSAVGVNRFVDRLFERGWDVRSLAGVRLAAVGTGTAQALQDRGLKADLIPTEHRGEALAEALLKELAPGGKVLIARAQEGREALPEALTRGGAQVEVVASYRSVPLPADRFVALKERLLAREIDAIALASGSAARALVASVGGPDVLASCALAALGPVTAQAVEELGLKVAIQAPSATFEQLAEAICRYFVGRRR